MTVNTKYLASDYQPLCTRTTVIHTSIFVGTFEALAILLPMVARVNMLPIAIPKHPAKGHSLSCYKVSASAMRNFASNNQRDTSPPPGLESKTP